MPIDVMNASIGVSSVLANNDNITHLPKADIFVSNNVDNISLDNLFGNQEQAQALHKALSPSIDRPEQLTPPQISRNLEACADKLKEIKDGDIRRFVRDDLNPLLENTSLLKAYVGLMVEG